MSLIETQQPPNNRTLLLATVLAPSVHDENHDALCETVLADVKRAPQASDTGSADTRSLAARLSDLEQRVNPARLTAYDHLFTDCEHTTNGQQLCNYQAKPSTEIPSIGSLKIQHHMIKLKVQSALRDFQGQQVESVNENPLAYKSIDFAPLEEVCSTIMFTLCF